MSMDGITIGTALPAPEAMPSAADASAILQSSSLRLSTAQKAAIIISALGPDAAGPIVERIEPAQLERFARTYAELRSIPKNVYNAVVAEFVGKFSTEDDSFNGGFAKTKDLLGQFVEADELTRVMDGINVPDGETVWEKLNRADETLFGEYLAKQNPQLIAVILAKMGTDKASSILDQFDVDLAGKVILRLTKPLKIRPEAEEVIAETIDRDFLAPMRTVGPNEENPGSMIGEMMNNIMSEKRQELLDLLNSNTPGIMLDIRKSMLTYQDIATRVPAKAITNLIKEVDLEVFLQAAKYGKKNAPLSVEFMFKNISQRMAQQYEEEMEKLKKISDREAEAAQSTFMMAVRKLVAEGEIELVEIAEEEEETEETAAE